MLNLDSDEWTFILREGLGARTMRLRDGGSVACYRIGPFRVAYPDFIIGSPSDMSPAGLTERIESARSLRADLIRLQTRQSPATEGTVAIHQLGTVAILSMQSWVEAKFQKSRRAANRQPRSPLTIRPGRASDGEHMHRMYVSTIKRNGGVAKYGRTYFTLLAQHATLIAELDGHLCGFVCVGFRGNSACYMHGAHAPEHRQHYVSDQLFLNMLRAAKDAGMQRFDFLPSPLGQPSLTAYKKSWGGSEENLEVADVALNPIRARCFHAALKMANIWSKLRRG